MAQPRIGVALSGGGVRGLAHIGILQAMEEEGIVINCIAGTSMGGLVAGCYAAGVPLETMARRACALRFLDFATPDPTRRGLFGHEKLEQLLVGLLGDRNITFADLQIPLSIATCDLESSKMVVLNSGPLIPALLATTAFPVAFAPVYHQGRWLVDGGPLNNLPVDLVRKMGADRVLAVNTPTQLEMPPQEQVLQSGSSARSMLSPRSLLSLMLSPQEWAYPFLIGEQVAGIALDATAQARISAWPPDLLLKVPMPNIGVFAVEHTLRAIQIGHETALACRADLKALRDRPLPPRWKRRLKEFYRRLRRAWAVLCDPGALLPG